MSEALRLQLVLSLQVLDVAMSVAVHVAVHRHQEITSVFLRMLERLLDSLKTR